MVRTRLSAVTVGDIFRAQREPGQVSAWKTYKAVEVREDAVVVCTVYPGLYPRSNGNYIELLKDERPALIFETHEKVMYVKKSERTPVYRKAPLWATKNLRPVLCKRVA
jgi:hypothetical protein